MLPLVVEKLGGSLFAQPDLRGRLRRWWERSSRGDQDRGSRRRWILPGGGAATDLVRAWDARFQLPPDWSHGAAIGMMSVHAALLQCMLPELPRATSLGAAEEPLSPVVILDPAPCIADLESRGTVPLPRTWDLTSDSIAAWIASSRPGAELRLLKSTDLPDDVRTLADRPARLARLAADGMVDPLFPRYAAWVARISWVNLTRDELAATSLD